ncbi:hypothetical protein Lal_00022124 [Lupinus albus]|nr:hypothetical protein Lal_00022124 [Lupinus albus]
MENVAMLQEDDDKAMGDYQSESHSITHDIDLKNPKNPFFLHPEDNPGSLLVSTPLDGDNYNSWRRRMKHLLFENASMHHYTEEMEMQHGYCFDEDKVKTKRGQKEDKDKTKQA